MKMNSWDFYQKEMRYYKIKCWNVFKKIKNLEKMWIKNLNFFKLNKVKFSFK